PSLRFQIVELLRPVLARPGFELLETTAIGRRAPHRVEHVTRDLSRGVEPPGQRERARLPIEEPVIVVGLVADGRNAVPPVLPVGVLGLTVEETIPPVPAPLPELPGLSGTLSFGHVEPDAGIGRQESPGGLEIPAITRLSKPPDHVDAR